MNKLTRKATKVSDLSPVGKANTDPKGSDLMRSPSVHER
ncbi:hypothetical protein J2S07_004430 [Robertmurraya andreesenii]|uniref:Uncharacterized protein n=1 Tax=Anoxybacillus andreesenii TaxID=1325932 RepID=A0ABT9VAS5_9BACL|nr:hypothetical protein [Robertmurraya andreesenii]